MSRLPPVAVFAHARPRHLAKTLAALARCDGFSGSRAHLFCDAPRSEAEEPRVAAVHRVAANWSRRYGARVVLRRENRGLRNVTDGIGELCAIEGAVISLEEDHRPATTALRFLDRALARYRHDSAVFQVCAYRAGGRVAELPDTFFLPMPMPVGWGTWQRAWEQFTWECNEAHSLLRNAERRRAFDLDGAYPAATLLARSLAGAFDSYFIRWYWTIFKARGLVLCPRDSVVFNTGLESGVHGHASSERRNSFHNGAFNPRARSDEWAFPPAIAVDPSAVILLRTAFKRYAAP